MTWLYVPGTCSASAPASGDWSSASELPNPERALSCTWRGKQQLPQAWSRVWRRGGFIRLLSGLMQEPLTLDHGAASFIASCRETLASPIPSPGAASEPMTTDGLSTNFSASWMSAGLAVSSERTSRGTSRGSSPHWSRHWSGWASALRAEFSARPRSAPDTDASDSSLWPTARTVTGGPETAEPKQELGRTESGGGDLQAAVLMWPTTTVGDADSSGSKPDQTCVSLTDATVRGVMWPTASVMMTGERTSPETFRARQKRMKERHGSNTGNGAGTDLAMAAKLWPTARAEDLESSGKRHGRGVSDTLTAVTRDFAEQWPTPATRDHHAQGANHNPAAQSSSLATVVEKGQWPTPAARDHKGANSTEHVTTNGSGRMHMDQLPNFVAHAFPPSLPDPATPGGLPSSNERRILNPLFVEWLMGWPIGLSGFERAETEFSRWLQQMRGCLSRLASTKPDNDQGSLF